MSRVTLYSGAMLDVAPYCLAFACATGAGSLASGVLFDEIEIIHTTLLSSLTHSRLSMDVDAEVRHKSLAPLPAVICCLPG